MKHSTVFVGVDYATAFVQVCVLDDKGKQLANRKCDNKWKTIADCVSPHGTKVRAAIEACNGAADLAEEILEHAGWSIDLAHPGYVERMKQNPDKTDFTDARMLADLVRVGYLPKVWLAPQIIRELRRLVRYRQNLVKRRTALKLRFSGLLRDHRCIAPKELRSFTNRWWEWFDQQIFPRDTQWIQKNSRQELETIQKRVTESEHYLENVTREDPYVQRIQQFPGIGLVTACWLRAEIGDPTRFRNGKQLARFCGLTPRNASSGLRQADAGLIHMANRDFRAILIEAAHRLKRYDLRWRKLADSMKDRGKPGSVIAAAIGNRWIRGFYHELIRIAEEREQDQKDLS